MFGFIFASVLFVISDSPIAGTLCPLLFPVNLHKLMGSPPETLWMRRHFLIFTSVQRQWLSCLSFYYSLVILLKVLDVVLTCSSCTGLCVQPELHPISETAFPEKSTPILIFLCVQVISNKCCIGNSSKISQILWVLTSTKFSFAYTPPGRDVDHGFFVKLQEAVPCIFGWIRTMTAFHYSFYYIGYSVLVSQQQYHSPFSTSGNCFASGTTSAWTDVISNNISFCIRVLRSR